MHSIGRAVRRLQTGLLVGLSDRDDFFSHAHIPTPCHWPSSVSAGCRFTFQHELLAGRRAKPEHDSHARVH